MRQVSGDHAGSRSPAASLQIAPRSEFFCLIAPRRALPLIRSAIRTLPLRTRPWAIYQVAPRALADRPQEAADRESEGPAKREGTRGPRSFRYGSANREALSRHAFGETRLRGSRPTFAVASRLSRDEVAAYFVWTK